MGFAKAAGISLALCVHAFAQGIPTVALLTTGGTIATKADPAKGGRVPAISGEDLVAAVPAIKKVAQIRVEQIANVGSTDITPAIWLRLAERANELAASPDIAGIVVTHGTNTLEETAYFLDLTITSNKPVIVVGSQRAAFETDSDGPRNLLDAIRVAVAPDASAKGVMVAMNGQINSARDVAKTNTIQVEAFRSLEFGALGTVDAERVHFSRAPLGRQTFPVDSRTKLGRVEIVASYLGSDGMLIRWLAKQNAIQGLVVEGMGNGGVSHDDFEAIRELRGLGVPVVISTRVPTGRIVTLDAGLRQMGCVLAGNLSPLKARILLMLALTKTHDPDALQKYFDN